MLWVCCWLERCVWYSRRVCLCVCAWPSNRHWLILLSMYTTAHHNGASTTTTARDYVNDVGRVPDIDSCGTPTRCITSQWILQSVAWSLGRRLEGSFVDATTHTVAGCFYYIALSVSFVIWCECETHIPLMAIMMIVAELLDGLVRCLAIEFNCVAAPYC